jgi:hypothetical protein
MQETQGDRIISFFLVFLEVFPENPGENVTNYKDGDTILTIPIWIRKGPYLMRNSGEDTP